MSGLQVKVRESPTAIQFPPASNAFHSHWWFVRPFKADIPQFPMEQRLWAERAEDLLNRHWLQHAVGVQFQGAAPQRRLEDVVQMLAPALFTGLGKQSRPL